MICCGMSGAARDTGKEHSPTGMPEFFTESVRDAGGQEGGEAAPRQV
jgi:hypothetical protein